MKNLLVMSIALLVVIVVRPASADEMSPQEQLKAWGDEFVGTWVNEQTLETDMPGLGEKGDKLSGEVTFKEVKGVYQATWKGDSNGKSTDFGIAVIGWDPTKQRITVQWFTKNARAATATYVQRGNKWMNRFILISSDGTKTTETRRISTSGDAHVHLVTNRKRGEESLPDKEETWTRK